jgi:hypothetical protein
LGHRIGDVIHSYEKQGFHSTGTAVDRISGEWLADEVRAIGLKPILEEFYATADAFAHQGAVVIASRKPV